MRALRLIIPWLPLIVAAAAFGQNPVPYIYQPLVPPSAAPGGQAFTLVVSGTGFVSGAIVRWNAAPLNTAFVSSSRLTANVPAASIANPGTASITVVNPGTTAASNVIYFPVAQPRQTVAFTYPATKPNLGLPPQNDPSTLVVGDFNGDGKPDIALAEPQLQGGSLIVLLGDGGGTFTMLPPAPAPRPGEGGMAVGDFNGDGKLDLAMTDSQANTVTVLLGNGDGTFTAALGPPAPVGSFPLWVVAADFNGDGKLDLAVLNSNDGTVSILLGKGDGTFQTAPGSPIPVGPGSLDLAVGDFNSDGKLDLAVSGAPFGSPANSITILLGNGDGSFRLASGSPVQVPNSPQPSDLAVGDFNGDGKLDLAVAAGENDTVGILLGNGDGTFAAVPGCCGSPQELTNNHGDLAIGDFDGNGKLDLALAIDNGQAGTGANYTTTMLGNGDGTFTPGNFSILQDAFQTNMAVGDFNDDGQLDLATTDPTYAELTILLQAPPPGNGPDFSLASTGSTSVSVQAGSTASFPLKVTSLNGFIGTVSFSDSGCPAEATCSLLTYSGNLPEPNDFLFATEWGLFQLSVRTAAPSASAVKVAWPRQGWPLGIWTALVGLALLVAIMIRGGSGSTRWLGIMLLAALMMNALPLAGCGGPPQPIGGTLPGTYTLTVTGVSGNMTHSTTVTLAVQ